MENVDRCHRLVKLNAVEEGRRAIDKANVPQVQITVAAPHFAIPLARVEKSCVAR